LQNLVTVVSSPLRFSLKEDAPLWSPAAPPTPAAPLAPTQKTLENLQSEVEDCCKITRGAVDIITKRGESLSRLEEHSIDLEEGVSVVNMYG
ncbi:hypothetical protein PENTCL1PPCAC_26294, partial [Pristionchus entomophagus]